MSKPQCSSPIILDLIYGTQWHFNYHSWGLHMSHLRLRHRDSKWAGRRDLWHYEAGNIQWGVLDVEVKWTALNYFAEHAHWGLRRGLISPYYSNLPPFTHIVPGGKNQWNYIWLIEQNQRPIIRYRIDDWHVDHPKENLRCSSWVSSERESFTKC